MNKLFKSGNQEFQIRFRDDIVRYLHQKQQLNNLVQFGDNYLTYRVAWGRDLRNYAK